MKKSHEWKTPTTGPLLLNLFIALSLGFSSLGCENSTTGAPTEVASGESSEVELEGPETDTSFGGEGSEADPNTCGDGDCGETEGCEACPEDCGPCQTETLCGDSDCSGKEECDTCPEDCGPCAPSCGDGTCDATETCESCEDDCGGCAPICGDGECNSDETCSSCAADCGECPEACGNGVCGEEESCLDCPSDCGVCPDVCGDGTCATSEDCETCAEDCGECPESCGNGVCDSGEDCSGCPGDCGSCDCADPGLVPPFPVDGICQPSGCKGGFVDCPLRVARVSEDAEAPSALQFSVNYDPTVLVLDNFYDEICFAEDVCSEVPLAKSMAKGNATSHTFTLRPPGEAPATPTPGQSYTRNGVVHVIVANFSGAEILAERGLPRRCGGGAG